MNPLDAFVLITVLFLPPITAKVAYRKGQKDAQKAFKDAEGIRLRYCQCRVQKPAE